jgi:signal transduction histidine kinase
VAEAVDTFRLEGIQADITVETEIEACSAVMASAGAIEAVVWELCRNSVEAMKTGGVLRVKAGDVIEREDRRSTCGIAVKAGTYVAIGVSDTGPGVPSAILPVAIQPFVTGKEGKARRGAGLGLSLAYAVARDHRGHLDMESRQGKGTTVVLEIPVKTGGGSVS